MTTTAPTRPTPLPADIRLMNATAFALAVVAVLALAAAALSWVARQPVFAIQAIRVEGDLAHNSALTIRANAAPRLAGTCFTLDLAAGRRAFEAVPWVRRAVVRRVWPNRLAVRLEEHHAVALWTSAGSDDEAAEKLVNSYGEVFEANVGDVEDDSLPMLRGPDGTSGRMLVLLTRLQPVFAAMHARIDTLELSGRGSWRAALDTGATVAIGRGTDDELVARTQAFVTTLPELASRYERPLQYADLRHRDGYAVRLEGVSTTPDAAPARPQKKK